MFESTHKLKFEVSPWHRDPDGVIKLYRVGTCEGQWFDSNIAFHILSINNTEPGNGHLTDVFEWFENSCKTYHKALMIMDFVNQDFKLHCIKKRGFTEIPKCDHLIKTFSLWTLG